MSAIKYVPKGQILVVADCNNDAAKKKKSQMQPVPSARFHFICIFHFLIHLYINP